MYAIGSISNTLCTLRSWVTGATTIASGWSYVGGASLTASGNKIRESLKKEIAQLEKQATASGIKMKRSIERKAKVLSKHAHRNHKR